MLRNVLLFASAVEAGTGLALMVNPALVVRLLLGAELAGAGVPLGRCFGIAILALGVACWPSAARVEAGSPAIRAMLIYNALIAAYLGWLGTYGNFDGPLLWAGVAVHAVVALLLASAWRTAKHKAGSMG
jgi:hypothetical protein